MYQCTAACEHCCFSCSPRVTDRLPPERLADFILQAKKFETIKVVVFTGGECFLLGEDLNQLVSLAKSEGYSTRVVTNGYWANSRESAINRLTALKRNGLDEVNFSTGYYHQKYVPLKNIVNGISAGIDLGLHGAIMIEDVVGSSGTSECLMKVEKIAAAVSTGKLRIIVSPWMSFKGKDIINLTPRAESETLSCGGCHTVLSVIAITPTEDLYACCGLPMREIPEMKLMNLKGILDIRKAIDELPDDFMKIWLSVEGPFEILKFASQYDSKISVPSRSMHVCEACRYLYSNMSTREVLGRYMPDKRSEIILEYFRRLNCMRISA